MRAELFEYIRRIEPTNELWDCVLGWVVMLIMVIIIWIWGRQS